MGFSFGKGAIPLLSVLAFSLDAAAAGPFQKIADQNTAIPNGVGSFSSFSDPQVSLGDIVFAGGGANNQRGVYRFNPVGNTLSILVDGNAALPGVPGAPAVVPSLLGPSGIGLSVYGNDVSFMASALGGELITTRNGLHDAADSFTAQPVGPFTLSSMDSQNLYFRTSGNSSVAPPATINVYGSVASNGSVNVPLQQNPIFKFIARGGNGPAYSSNNGRIVGTVGPFFFQSSAGAFIFSDGALAGPQTPNFHLPGESSGAVNAGGEPIFSDDGNAAAFFASSGTQKGFYTHAKGGLIQAVATDSTIVPTFDSVSKFAVFSNITIDNGNIAFIAGPTDGPLGIFDAIGGNLSEVVSVGDILDGKTISALSFSGDRPLSGSDLVFTANFSDGSTGLFLAQVPEPATVSLLALGLTPTLVRRRGER